MADASDLGPNTSAGFAMFPLRLGLTLIFLFTGAEKLFNLDASAPLIALTGVPWPVVMTVFVGLAEVLGATAILLGVMTRTAAAGLSMLMLTILLTLKIPGPFWGDGWGIDTAVLAGTLTLVLSGPGRPTLWSIMGRDVLDPEVRLLNRLAASRRSRSTSRVH